MSLGLPALGRRSEALIGEPGDLPSRRSSGGREEFSAGGKAKAAPLQRHKNQDQAAHVARLRGLMS